MFLTGQEEIESVARSVREVSLDLPSGELTLTIISLVNFLQFIQILLGGVHIDLPSGELTLTILSLVNFLQFIQMLLGGVHRLTQW